MLIAFIHFNKYIETSLYLKEFEADSIFNSFPKNENLSKTSFFASFIFFIMGIIVYTRAMVLSA